MATPQPDAPTLRRYTPSRRPPHARTFRIWRGDATGRASSRTTRTEVVEGMVVLDAVHQIQAEQANDLAVRWNCKAGKCGSCSAEINGKPQADVHDAARRAAAGRAGHRRADAARSRTITRPGDRRVVELPRSRRRSSRSSRARPTRPTAPGACSRRTSTACRSSASASSASCARTSATCCATTTSTTSSSARASWSTPPRWRCTRSTPRTASRELQGGARHRLLQHHQVLHQGLPRAHHHHRQRDHPAQGAGGRRVLRSVGTRW